jgi:hypothetical protein
MDRREVDGEGLLMSSGKELDSISIFYVFFGIFWYSVIYYCNRYRPFDTHRLFRRNQAVPSARAQAARRFVVAFLLVDIAPICGIWALGRFAVADGIGFWNIASAGFAALSVLSVTRLLHGILATEAWEQFYSPAEYYDVLHAWRPHPENEPNSWISHVFPGLGFMGLFVGLAFFAKAMA